MAQGTRASAKRSDDGPPVRRRLTAEARQSSILKAARRAFTETGDMNGTTIRAIAERGGISEGVIYRHFESKDQLFFEAVVEPLREAVDALVEAAAIIDRDEPLTPERQLGTLEGLYRRLTATLEEVLPLLGLVLFGDPKVAQRFYRESFAAAMDRLADAWKDVEHRYGIEVESPDISARAVMGMALVLALESHHSSKFDRDRVMRLISEGTIQGFFPRIDPEATAPLTDPVEVVHELGRRFRAGDHEGAFALFHPGFRIQQPASFPHGGWHDGREGMAAMGATFAEHWDRTIGEARVLGCGDTVVQLTTQTWRAKKTGKAATVDVVELFSFGDGLISEIRVFQQDTHALLATLGE